MTQTIEQLKAKVAELEEENARLRFALADTEALELGTSERLAASQAYAEQLREALVVLNGVSDIGCERVYEALALPHSTSALDAYVAEKVKAASTQLLEKLEQLTRQRDLAVEALKRQLADAKHCQQVMCNEVGIGFLDVVTLSNSESVLSAIKESEAK